MRLPQNMVSIPVSCFNHCRSLIYVLIPVKVRGIRSGSFRGCKSLTSIDLSENIDAIEREAYSYCISLLHVTIRSSSADLHLEHDVFENCPELSSITAFPSVWPKLFHSMNNEIHPNFIFKFLKEYHYHLDRLIEWKKTANNTIYNIEDDDEDDEEEVKRQKLR